MFLKFIQGLGSDKTQIPGVKKLKKNFDRVPSCLHPMVGLMHNRTFAKEPTKQLKKMTQKRAMKLNTKKKWERFICFGPMYFKC